jgi:hypothetical protein
MVFMFYHHKYTEIKNNLKESHQILMDMNEIMKTYKINKNMVKTECNLNARFIFLSYGI